MRSALKLTVGIAVSLGCLYFATRGTDWGRVGHVLATADPRWVAALVAVSAASLYIRAQRWRILLRPLGDVRLYPALSATAIGFGASAVLPFRLGELVRPALLGRRCGFGMSAALSSVVLERLFDMLLVISCFLVVGLVYPVPTYLRQGAAVLAVAAGAGFVILLLVLRHRRAAQHLLERLLDVLPVRLSRALGPVAWSFMDGLGALNDVPTVLLVVGYSAYLWGVITCTFTFGMLALGLDVPLFAASLATVVIVAAFVFLPQAPGFVGTWQAGCVVALDLFGVPQDLAVGFSILTWLASMFVNVGSAGLFLAREDLSLRQLVATAAAEAPATGTEG